VLRLPAGLSERQALSERLRARFGRQASQRGAEAAARGAEVSAGRRWGALHGSGGRAGRGDRPASKKVRARPHCAAADGGDAMTLWQQ
jgi:hypothetical protein